MTKNRSQWNVNKDFLPAIPEEEAKKKFAQVVPVIGQICVMSWKPLQDSQIQEVNQLSIKKPFAKKVKEVMDWSNNLQKVRGCLARVIQAIKMKSRDGCSLDPTVQDYADADWWMAWVSMADTLSAIKDMKNSPLLPFWSGGLLVTHGAFKQTSLERALGHPTLIILSHNSRLAKLILIACHYEDHRRSETDALYRSRKRGVWIIKGRLLSKAVTKSCPVCARMNKKTASQLMGSLPEVKLKVPCRPFSHISIDLGAPILCKVSRNVRQKCYPIVFCCLNLSLIHI